jgi:hypothetical protein
MAEPEPLGLLQLPQNVLRMIALKTDLSRSDGGSHNPLLRVSTGGRSAVLGKAREISLHVGPSDCADLLGPCPACYHERVPRQLLESPSSSMARQQLITGRMHSLHPSWSQCCSLQKAGPMSIS